jgi:hypothetical protein
MPKGINYSKEDLVSFLDAIEDILPISSTAWGSIVKTYMSMYPDTGWTVDSLKHKFKKLNTKKVPTGDPLCPPAVYCTKLIMWAIIAKMDGSNLNSEGGNGGEELVVPPLHESDKNDSLINSDDYDDDDGKFGVCDGKEVDGAVGAEVGG